MKISVFGSGYVGLVQAAVLAEVGHDVLCMDIDRNRSNASRRASPASTNPGSTPCCAKAWTAAACVSAAMRAWPWSTAGCSSSRSAPAWRGRRGRSRRGLRGGRCHRRASPQARHRGGEIDRPGRHRRPPARAHRAAPGSRRTRTGIRDRLQPGIPQGRLRRRRLPTPGPHRGRLRQRRGAPGDARTLRAVQPQPRPHAVHGPAQPN